VHVWLLITNNAFLIVQRATAQSKTGLLRDYGVAEAPPGFQAGWSDCLDLEIMSSKQCDGTSAITPVRSDRFSYFRKLFSSHGLLDWGQPCRTL
jgi:hypothetical protein